jgi:hypothetical protein
LAKGFVIMGFAVLLVFNLACSRGEDGEPAETVADFEKVSDVNEAPTGVPDEELGELINPAEVSKWAGREDEAIKLVQHYRFPEPREVVVRFRPQESRKVETIKEYLEAEAELEASVDEPVRKRGVDMPIPGYFWMAKHLPKRAPATYIVSHIKQYDRGDTTKYYYRFNVNLETGEVGPEDEPTKYHVFDE